LGDTASVGEEAVRDAFTIRDELGTDSKSVVDTGLLILLWTSPRSDRCESKTKHDERDGGVDYQWPFEGQKRKFATWDVAVERITGGIIPRNAKSLCQCDWCFHLLLSAPIDSPSREKTKKMKIMTPLCASMIAASK